MTTHIQFQSYSVAKKIYILLAFLLLCNFSFGQEKAKKTTDPLPLKELKGYTQTFYYSPGYEARAEEIAVFLEDAGNYFQEEIKFIPKIELYILAPQHWKGIAVQPLQDVYGFPIILMRFAWQLRLKTTIFGAAFYILLTIFLLL